VKIKAGETDLRHPAAACTHARMDRGVLGLQVWQRPAQPVAQARHRQLIEAKERSRWLQGYQPACEVQPRCPDTDAVNGADREGDAQEWCLDAVRRGPGERAELIIRATCNRRIAPRKEPRSLGEEMQQARPVGAITVELTRQPTRPPRPATLTVAVKPVTFTGARRPGRRLPPVEVVAVQGKDRRPLHGRAPIAWLLLTSLPAADVPSACTIVQWYRCRWESARFSRVLKHGGQLTQLRLQTDRRLLSAKALYLSVAWRIHSITMAGRTDPAAPGDMVFEPREWHTICLMRPHRHPHQASPSLREMVQGLAHHGGFLARRGDG
jgi:Transposase Tn5 dimerisation domain